MTSRFFIRPLGLMSLSAFSLAFSLCVALPNVQSADQPSAKPKPLPPKIAGPSPQGQLAISGFQIPKGMKAELVAAEPLLANPVAFYIDEKGQFYVCETFRQQKGVEDNRSHMNWLHDDLAAQTVEDRLKYFRKHLGEKVNDYTKQDDRIRLLRDTDGDGLLDSATVFASGFNAIEEGTGAGVLAYRGNVYYTCIPKLWKLRDSDNDGVADHREALHNGYGVRVAFRGHDMHGLTLGPDGRLYFSIGDRGYNVVTQEGKRLKRPDTGAVFRCELDGSHLEVFAYGLRNPQELAFDNHGNLFTGDNNCDSGDRARWVYVVRGSDAGWRMYYQYLRDRGPWNREMIWYPHNEPALTRKGPGGIPVGSVAAQKQPAYIVPPVANLADGPSGLTYYPGVGLPERYKNHFFLADFRGNAGRSGIRSFSVKPKGAGFELTDSHQFLWKILATDVDFGYDGNLYATDWVSGWNGPGKGRIYRFRDPQHAPADDRNSAAQIMKKGFDNLSVQELVNLLEHADRRIRLEAQFELAGRNQQKELMTVVSSSDNQLARIHALWGLAQILRRNKLTGSLPVMELSTNNDPEIRAQTMKFVGEFLEYAVETTSRQREEMGKILLQGLKDRNARVRFFAALNLGRTSQPEHMKLLAGFLMDNNDNEPLLRHAGVMGLTGLGRQYPRELQQLGKHPHRSVRMAALLAWRRIAHERFRQNEDKPGRVAFGHFSQAANEVAGFLKDVDPGIVLEAARAFDEIEHTPSMNQLAALAKQPESAGMSPALLRRVLNAAFRGGTVESAKAVASLAANARVAEALRLEAIDNLQNWNEPPKLDRVTGKWRPIQNRKPIAIANVIRPFLAGMLSGSNSVRQAGAQLAARYGIKEVGPLLYGLFADKSNDADVRVEALRALDAMNSRKLAAATTAALSDQQASVRATGLEILGRRDKQRAFAVSRSVLQSGSPLEKQTAVAVLASLKNKTADTVLLDQFQKIRSGKIPAEIHLDLIEALKRRNTPTMKKALDQFEATRSKSDHLANYRESLAGGNAARGREIFFNRTAVSCRRCHKIQGSGGDVGPDLSGIALQKKREYLLEAIVLPNKQIAKGFDSVTLAMDSGKVYSGIVKKEDDKTIELMLATGQRITLPKDEIDDRAKGKSAMPADLVKHLSKRDLRDLVEFLSELKKPVKSTQQ
ncbi:MAG: c-type cytochrome [Planctomycetaceae bacterium]